MLHHVFISYSRRDRAWVDDLTRALEARGIDYWIDRRGIPFSVPWRQEVEDAVQACDLFLVCDSEPWRLSPACATEAAYAVQYGKVRLGVPTGQDLGLAADQVGRAWRQSTRRHGTATELAVRARDWNRQGRGGKGLAPLKLRRKFAILRKERDLSQLENAYLAASRRHTRRQVLVSAGLSLLLMVAYTSGRVGPGVEKEVNKRLAAQATQYMKTQAALSVIDRDPYQGLRLAATRGNNESAPNANVLEAALAVNLPDDAFTLSAEGRRFTDATVGAQVHITAKDDTLWARRAQDRTRRAATRIPQAPSMAANGSANNLSSTVITRWRPGSARMRVLHHGAPWRTVILPSPAHQARLSPDARWSAVATDTGVALVDLTRGTVREVLRGAPAPLTDLAWTAHGDRIWGLKGHQVVSWHVSDGQMVLDQPDAWFQSVLPAHDSAHLWVVSRQGKLQLVTRTSGAVVRSLKAGDAPVASAAVDAQVTNMAVVGGDWARIVNLTTGRTSPVRLPADCTPARPVYAPNGRTLYLPCLGSDVLAIDARTHQTTGKIHVPAPGVSALSFESKENQLLLSTAKGSIYSAALRPGAEPKFLYRVGCGLGIDAIATAPGPWILPVGEGTGLAGCTKIARPKDDGSLRWDSLIDSPPDSVLALAAAFDPTGKAFAIGFSDGSLMLHPSVNFMPRTTFFHISGGVRSLLSLPNLASSGKRDDLYVATRSGLVMRLAWCPNCLSNKAMARTADQRLKRAQALGLYRPRAASPTRAPTVRKST